MGLAIGVDSAKKASRLLTTASQGALFLPQMSIQTDTVVLTIYTLENCNHYDTETPNKWYEQKPLLVVDTPKVNILWDFPIRADRTIQTNRPDIVIKHK